MSERSSHERADTYSQDGELSGQPLNLASGDSEVAYVGGYRQTMYEYGTDGFRVVLEDPVTGEVIADDSYSDF